MKTIASTPESKSKAKIARAIAQSALDWPFLPFPSTPLAAIRRACFTCGEKSAKWIKDCPIKSCALHPLRLGKSKRGKAPLKLIRAYCKQCVYPSPPYPTISLCDLDGNIHQSLCAGGILKSQQHTACPLHPFRTGHRPNNKTLSLQSPPVVSTDTGD